MTNFILLENGSALLQETGDNLILDVPPINIAISKSIDFNNGLITTSTLSTLTFTGNTPSISLTADGTNYEIVTLSVPHTFTNTGTDLRWKAEGAGTTITKLKISDYH